MNLEKHFYGWVTQYIKSFSANCLNNSDRNVATCRSFPRLLQYSVPFVKKQRAFRAFHNTLPKLVLHRTRLSWWISNAGIIFLLWFIAQNWRNEILPSIGVLRGGNTALVFTSPLHANSLFLVVYC
jgi:hypothetical protein